MKNTQRLPSELDAFSDYHEFETFCKSMFTLESWEYRQLYDVLVKLESVGENPVENMNIWKKSLSQEECLEFIRFMILVDSTDILMNMAA